MQKCESIVNKEWVKKEQLETNILHTNNFRGLGSFSLFEWGMFPNLGTFSLHTVIVS